MPAAIEVEHLTVSYGVVPALLDVSFSVEPGQLIGIIGPNGSGKSTLIKSVLGFIRPDFGAVRLFGEPADRTRGPRVPDAGPAAPAAAGARVVVAHSLCLTHPDRTK